MKYRISVRAILLALCFGLIAPMTVEAKKVRSYKAKQAFKYQHPCPANGRISGPCPGYVIDHIYPLACGGLDDPSNMQWQTKGDAKAKDKWERKNCRR